MNCNDERDHQCLNLINIERTLFVFELLIAHWNPIT